MAGQRSPRWLRDLLPSPVAVDLGVHEDGIRLAERFKLRTWDAMMLAAALRAGCDVFWSEDMQDGLLIDRRLQIANPFAPESLSA